ncbi:hypothetical protein IJH89_01315 [Candidatus Saccharibacteria bacterium]|nr:hypothetical protein [Candidatus Saccharibacteria bacterium]
MKLRNKKTGAIYGIADIDLTNNGIWLGTTKYNSFAELNEEWEDVPEEPKIIWYLDYQGQIRFADSTNDWTREKEIGNYFESKEEAEKAVEKLKAWKRLKEKGFEFEYFGEYESLCGNGFAVPIRATMPPENYTDTEVAKDLRLLFEGQI